MRKEIQTHDSALLFNYLARPCTACGTTHTTHTQYRENEHQASRGKKKERQELGRWTSVFIALMIYND